MKKILLSMLCATVAMTAAAQTKGVVDTASSDTIDLMNPPVPQIPLSECDSTTVGCVTDRYCVVWKAGKCGVYDLVKHENVTRIEYGSLRYGYRKEFEGEWYTYFVWEEEKTLGVVGVSEVNNQILAIAMPKEEKSKDVTN